MCGVEMKNNSNGIINGNGNGKVNGNGYHSSLIIKYENVIATNNGNGNGNGIAISNGDLSSPKNDDVVINLDQGDPKMYYPFWKKVDDKCSVTIKASDLMSYFADLSNSGVFYQMPEFTDAVRRVHNVVGNAVAEDRYIIGGTGSSQLFTVALRALASRAKTSLNDKQRIPVVCAEPYYSCYGEALEESKSEMYKWEGDANKFNHEEGRPYIEVVTSPNNPDGQCREPVVNKEGGMVICDLAYYWPQYTPITEPADYDVMLFTLSKATGHAGSRVGWAIVKDKEIAMAMIKVMTLETIGTCHEGQLRATKILEFVADGYEQIAEDKPLTQPKGFFEFGHQVLAERWEKLRAVVNNCGAFSLLEFPTEFCNFLGKHVQPHPAYAWMELKSGGDAAGLMSELKIRTRCGSRFGVSSKYMRVNMMDSDDTFNLFLKRLSTIQVE